MSAGRVLVVEDNPITLKMARIALEIEGYEVVTAADGAAALAVAAAQPPDVVLQDLVLPDIDGIEVLRRFRRLPGCAQVPVLAFTGVLSKAEKARADDVSGDAGFAQYLFKPVEPRRIVAAVAAYVATGRSPAAGQAGRTVLLVDDDPTQRKLTRVRLERAGYRVRTAEDGQAALSDALQAPPDLVLSDVLMPVMDGFRLCHAVRTAPSLQDVPVVLMSSAYTEEEDRAFARAVGATSMLSRAHVDELVGAVRAALDLGPLPGPGPLDGERLRDYNSRIARQLEQQAAHNARLQHRLALHRAEMTVLAGLGEVLGEGTEPALCALLHRCCDATGVSKGAAFVLDAHGALVLSAQFGYDERGMERLTALCADADLRRRVVADGQTVVLAHDEAACGDVLARLGATSALAAPIVTPEGRRGVFVMASITEDLDEDWIDFARAVGVQMGQVVALARAFGALSENERALRESQQLLQAILDGAEAAIYVKDREGRYLLVNQRVAEILGRPASEIVGLSNHDFFPKAVAAAFRVADDAALGGREPIHAEESLPAEDGLHTFLSNKFALRDAAGEPYAVCGISTDITDRKRAELALAESEARYRALFQNSPQPKWVFDGETLRFLAVNQAAVEHYGYSEAEFLSMTIADIRPPEDVPALRAHLASPQAGAPVRALPSRHLRKDGTVLQVEIASHPIAFGDRPAHLVLATDVSARRLLEEQFRQSQKMEAVGRLAGGVAHDFNNLLGVITGYSELLQRDLGPGHPARRRLDEIHRSADRAAGLTRQLLAFSRRQVLQPRVIDLNAVLTDMEQMLRRLIGEDVELVARYSGGERVLADPGQMEQVVMNLAVNARDAMPTGGTLVIETRCLDLDEAYVALHPDVAPGRYCCLSVSDSGTGMDAATRQHIFEPFFTTKEQGTGLGLATVYGIVTQSGGHIHADSEPGEGTTFRIYLPRAEAMAETPDAPRAEPLVGGEETVLLVEDADALRSMVAEILGEAGYHVIEADAPAAAREQAGRAGSLHLLLTDVVMPGEGGPALAADLAARHPGLRVLYMSGYTDDAILHHGVLDRGLSFIQKPFTTQALLTAVREALDKPAEAGGVPS